MLHRAPSSMSSFSSYDSYYSDRSPATTQQPIMAHASAAGAAASASSPLKARPSSFSGNNNHSHDMSGTISRAHKKFALKAQKLSFSSIGTELSNSCSALYSMLTEGGGGGQSTTIQTETTPFGYNFDQTDNVAAHTQKGIDFFEKYGNFVKERALIEEEYATKLRNLAKKNFGKRKEDDAKSFTYISTFYTMLHELESLAGQHEVVAETLKKNINPQIMSKCAELRQTRKNQLTYLQKLNVDLSKAIEAMEKTHRSYAKAFKEAEAAHIKHEQNDKDLNLSRAAVEKSKNNVAYKNQLCEEAKKNYANALLIANDAKVKHYEVELPSLLEQMKAADVDRITNTRLAMQRTIEAETNVIRIIQVCYDEMLKAVSNINPESDTQIVVEQNVSGYPVPENYPFDDLGDPGQIVNPDSADSSSMKRGTLPLSTKNGSSKTSSIGRRQSMHQKFFGGGASEKPKINGVQSDYGNLPPQQRCRKIQSKLDELLKEQETLHKSLDGVEKMAEVYKGNPKMGNPKDVEPKIAEYRNHLTRVNSEIAKFKNLMENIQNEMRQSGSEIGLRSPYNGHSSPSSTASPRISSSGYVSAANTNRTSYSEESVSSEGSHGLSSRKITPIPAVNGNASKPIISLQKEPSPIRPAPPAQSHEATPDTYEEVDRPVLGVCIARYAFEGTTDGTTIAIKEGEELLLLEKDVGDGWTFARHPTTQIAGFVPTSYLDCTWY